MDVRTWGDRTGISETWAHVLGLGHGAIATDTSTDKPTDTSDTTHTLRAVHEFLTGAIA